MIRAAALGCIAVLYAFVPLSLAQTGTMQLSYAGSAGKYNLSATYKPTQPALTRPTGSVTFEDTSYSNAVLATVPLSAATLVFDVQNTYVGELASPQTSVIARDFDGDNKPDLVFIDDYPSIIFAKGNGDGSFQYPVRTSLPSNASSTLLVAGDFNGDGKLDIAYNVSPYGFVQGPGTQNVYVALGNGNGTFQVATTLTESIPLYGRQTSLLIGDFNGDNKLDLYSNNGVSAYLYLGNGDGTFQPAITTLPGYGPAGDFNGDGRTDVKGYGNDLLMGQASGGFQLLNSPVSGTAVGDVNGDGKLDFAFSNGVCLGNGDGTFQPATTYDLGLDPSYYSWELGSSLLVDLNGDGKLDIATKGAYYATREAAIFGIRGLVVAVLFGNGDGTFQSPVITTLGSSSSIGFGQTAAANFDGTGVKMVSLDGFSIWMISATTSFKATANNVAVTPTGSHSIVAKYLGDAHSPAATSSPVTVQGATATSSLTLTSSTTSSTYYAPVVLTATLTPCILGTYSCDHDLIMLYEGSTLIGGSYPTSGVLTITLRNLSQGSHTLHTVFAGNSFLSSSTSNSVTINIGPPAGIIGDLQLLSSGSPDHYTLSATFSSSETVIPPTGNVQFVDVTSNAAVLATATFGAQTLKLAGGPSTDIGNISSPRMVFAGDFNHDGKADLLYPTRQGQVGFLAGNGDGTFQHGSLPLGDIAFACTIADFNNDGNADVLTQSYSTNPNKFQLQLGNGDGTFGSVTNAILDTTPTTSIDIPPVLAGDFNGDGKQDVYNATTKNVFFGNGNGSFQAAVATNIAALVAGDFNGDGRTDLLGPAGAYLGQSNGTFTTVSASSSNAYAGAILIGDFNGDNKLDFITSQNTLLLGNGDGTFQAAIGFDVAANVAALTIPQYFTGDFNGDGKLDLGVISYNATKALSEMVVIFGDGTGHFSNKRILEIDAVDSVPPYQADFTSKNRADIAAIGGGTLFSNISVGIWSTSTTYTASVSEISVSTPGTHYVHAYYPGDTTYLDKTSNVISLQGRSSTSLTLGINPNPIASNSPVTLTGTLAPFSDLSVSTDGEPLLFYDGSTLLGSGILASGTAQFSTSTLLPGTHSITVQYQGDDAFKPVTSAPLSLVVNASVTINWPAPAAISYGTPLSATQLNASTTVAGSFAYTPAAGTVLDAGSHNLSTAFTPEDTTAYNNATASTTLVVNKATPAISLTASPASISVGAGVTLRVIATTSYGTPGGSVNFYDNGTLLGSSTLSSGIATLSQSFTTSGTHSLSASYTGDSNFNTGSSSLNLLVVKTAPTITWTSPAAITYGTPLSAAQLNATSATAGSFAYTPTVGTVLPAGSQTLSAAFTPTDTATYNNATANTTLVVNKATPTINIAQTAPGTPGANVGTPVTLTATIATAYGTPTGTVIFYDGATPLGTGTLSSSHASLTTSFTVSGSHSISASYAGDSNFTTATATPFTLGIGKTTPTITWTSPAAITYGTPLSAAQLNATSATAGSFAYTPTVGTVLPAGSQTLSAAFTPTDTATYNNATANTTLVVNKATPIINIAQTAPGTPGVGTGVSVTFQATLSAAYGSPSGSVLFYDGTTLIGTGTISGGAATVTTTFSTTGTHPITGVYSGDSNFNVATSSVFNEGVVSYGLTFSATPNPLTLKRGQTGTVTITGTPTGNYTGTVSFSCAGLPAFTTCAFTPSTLVFKGDNQVITTVMTINTNVSTSALTTGSSIRFAALFGLPLLAICLRKRRLQQTLLILFAAMLLPITGCGSNPQSNPAHTTPTGTQTVTINAQTSVAGSASQSLSLNIIIEP